MRIKDNPNSVSKEIKYKYKSRRFYKIAELLGKDVKTINGFTEDLLEAELRAFKQAVLLKESSAKLTQRAARMAALCYNLSDLNDDLFRYEMK